MDRQVIKNEFARNIVSNIREKISEFKTRKAQEHMERKNELDFEINKDLVNQFKKNKKTAFIALEKKTNVNLLTKPGYSIIDSSLFNQDIYSSKKGDYSKINNHSKNNQISVIDKSRDYIGRNEVSRNPTQEIKKQDMVSQLFNRLLSDNKRNMNITTKTRNENYNGITQKDKSTKDKIKNFFTQIDEPRRIKSNKENKFAPSFRRIGPAIFGPEIRQSNTNSLTTNNNIKHHYPTTTLVGGNNDRGNSDLQLFSDFSFKNNNTVNRQNKTRRTSSDSFNFNNNHNTNYVEPIYRNNLQLKADCPIKSGEIRSLTNKIRFLSGQEVKNFEKDVIDAFSNLRSILNQLFDTKMKGNDFKIY